MIDAAPFAIAVDRPATTRLVDQFELGLDAPREGDLAVGLAHRLAVAARRLGGGLDRAGNDRFAADVDDLEAGVGQQRRLPVPLLVALLEVGRDRRQHLPGERAGRHADLAVDPPADLLRAAAEAAPQLHLEAIV